MQKPRKVVIDKKKTLISIRGSFGIEKIKISDKFASDAYERVMKKIKTAAQ